MIPFVATALFISTSIFAARYQVVSQHPHHIKDLSRFVKTVSQTGRLWIVEGDEIPLNLKKHLKEVDGSEAHYLYASMDKNTANPMIRDQVSKISETLIRDHVVKLAGYKTRLVGTSDNEKATDEIEKNLSELGYVTEKICYAPRKCSVLADKKGAKENGKVILTMAHLDSVGRDYAGADDNASGTAVLLEMARVLSSYKNQKTIRFFVTNGEEGGLLGAKHYVDYLKKNERIKELALVINMDMVGWNSNGIVELETDAKFKDQAEWFAKLASSYTSLKTKITLGAWGSDHVPFLKAQVPALLTIEDWSTKTPCYHMACDRPEGLNYTYAAEIGRLNTAAVLEKDLLSSF